jgi:hypothetical protein
MKSEYQKRKAAGQCVRVGCKRKPKPGPNGKPRSCCSYHNELNRKNSEAFLKRKAAKKKARKQPTVLQPKASPVALPQTA